MTTESHESARQLAEIAVNLFLCCHDHIHSPNHATTHPMLHQLSHRTTFEAIRLAVYQQEPAELSKYTMADLIALLPLSAVYHISPSTGTKIGLFLSELAFRRQDSLFDYSAWLDVTMLDVYVMFPVIFHDDHYFDNGHASAGTASDSDSSPATHYDHAATHLHGHVAAEHQNTSSDEEDDDTMPADTPMQMDDFTNMHHHTNVHPLPTVHTLASRHSLARVSGG